MAALTPKELVSLLNIIEEDIVEKNSLENLCSRLHQSFTKQDHFKVGTALVTLLQQPELLPKPSQRLACVTFLFDMYKAEPVSLNPFAPVFIHLLNPSQDCFDPGQSRCPPSLLPSSQFIFLVLDRARCQRSRLQRDNLSVNSSAGREKSL